MTAHFILYVADQERSTAFYAAVLARAPRLHVPGMTEFDLADGAVLGLMPETGVRRLPGAAPSFADHRITTHRAVAACGPASTLTK